MWLLLKQSAHQIEPLFFSFSSGGGGRCALTNQYPVILIDEDIRREQTWSFIEEQEAVLAR